MRRWALGFLVVLVVGAAGLGPAGAAVIQDPARAVCADCPPLADQIRQLEQQYADNQKRYYEALGESMRLLRENLSDRQASADINRSSLPDREARAREIAERIAARTAAIADADKRAAELAGQGRTIRDEIGRLRLDLELCNRSCRTAGSGPPQVREPVTARSPTASENAPAAACKECQDLADRIRQTEERRRTVARSIEEAAASLDAMRATQAETQAEYDSLRSTAPLGGERTRRMEDAQRRLSRLANEIKQFTDRAEQLEGQEAALAADLIVLGIELDACNRRCRRRTEPRGDANGTTLTPGAGPRPARATACPECAPLVERLNQLEEQRRDLVERLELLRQRSDALQADHDKLLDELKELGDRGGRSPQDEARTRELLAQSDPLRALGIALRLATAEAAIRDELRKLEAEITRVSAELKACNDKCRTTETGSRFTQPKVYAPLAGAIVVGGLLLSGGGDSPSAPTSTAAPATTVTPPVDAPSPTPSPAPAPTLTPGSPVGTHNLRSCAVDDDPSRQDSAVQFCVRVPQLLAFSAGTGAMRVLGAAPFTALEGPYNTASGAFDLSSRGTVAGATGVLVRFTGAIDAAGNFTNARVAFGEGATRVVYRFETALNR